MLSKSNATGVNFLNIRVTLVFHSNVKAIISKYLSCLSCLISMFYSLNHVDNVRRKTLI